VYYGGRSPSTSHRLLADFLTRPHHADGLSLLRAADRLAVIDVHSGLGPTGRDTLMTPTDEVAATVAKHFAGGLPGITEKGPVESQSMGDDGAQGGAAEGYELTVGDFIPCALSRHAQARQGMPPARLATGFCQEFGTRPAVIVALSLVIENMAYHFGTSAQKEWWARAVFDAFFVSRQSFMASVMERGLVVLEQALLAVSTP